MSDPYDSDRRHRRDFDPEQWARMRREVPAFVEDVIASAVRGFRRGWSPDRPAELPTPREGLVVAGEQAVGRPMDPAAPPAPARPVGAFSRAAAIVLALLVAGVVVFALGLAFTVVGFVFSLLSAIFGLLSGIFGLGSGLLGATAAFFGVLKGLLTAAFVIVPVLTVVFAVLFVVRGGRRVRRHPY